MTTPDESTESDRQTEVSFPINSCTRQGLTALFREAQECDEQYAHNYFPEDVEEAWREIYDRIGEIKSVELTVEYEDG